MHTTTASRSSRILTVLAFSAVAAGCASTKTSNTGRTAMEQMLISNAVDQSLDKIDFQPLAGRSVYLDVTYLECIDKNYVIAATRDRILQAGAKLTAKPEDAEVVVEARAGAVGTDQTESYIGIPEVAMPGPIPIAIPQIKMWSRTAQTGTAKIGLVAIEAGSRTILGQGGSTLARSDDNNTYLFGLGPYQSGSVRREVTHGLHKNPRQTLPSTIAFTAPPLPGEPGRVRLASSDDDGTLEPAEEETTPAPVPEVIVPAGEATSP
ncbi:MAG: DUF6655 family protein [Planctomycetaceae bacterium]